METSLLYRSNQKDLCIALKEKLVSNDAQLKFTGLLNTVTGTWEHCLSGRWLVFNKLQGKKRRVVVRRAAKNLVCCGPIALFDSSSKGVRMGLHAGMRHVLDDSGDLWVKARADALVDSLRWQPSVAGVLQLNKVFQSITSNQDMKVTFQVQAVVDHQGSVTKGAALGIQENNWGVWLEKKNFTFTYDL